MGFTQFLKTLLLQFAFGAASLWQLGDAPGALGAYTEAMERGEAEARATGGRPDPAPYVNMEVLLHTAPTFVLVYTGHCGRARITIPLTLRLENKWQFFKRHQRNECQPEP